MHVGAGSDLLQLTFHGPLAVGSRPVAVLLQVLLKSKQLLDGTYQARTVAYLEQADYEGARTCMNCFFLLRFYESYLDTMFQNALQMVTTSHRSQTSLTFI